ncbi:hypothetical protein B0A52_00015 [Exophiala mesophila]|uniref:ATPase AAA-type core domain-containing protein n=1 Tax=Exophiala mesophila TaxID=212818 RepID=A0A438NIU5_EXOME|nr:hypothetical protein B0A52_00015 [Exophiala mesophila]
MATLSNMQEASSRAPSVAEAFFRHSSGARVNTDVVIADAIQNAYPGVPITIVPEYNANLQGYSAAGFASTQANEPNSKARIWPDGLKWTIFMPPFRRLDGGSGSLGELELFQSFIYKWNNFEFLVYLVDGRDGAGSFPTIRNQYILGDTAAVRSLIRTVGQWQSQLHEEIWVFNRGYWAKDPNLYQSILRSRWDDVILEESFKHDLLDTVERFFGSEEQYQRLRVPWKRGIIFYGPPGNGKTISIKATMHSLYQRSPPVPTLYVKSLVSFVPPEYSIEAIFAKARQEAPCYLVFEDLDSLVTDEVRSFFLNAVDGISDNQGILMVGSTNHLERLDPGIAKRPSRFDRKYLFSNPNLDQRVQYNRFWQNKLKSNKDLEFPEEIVQAAAKITDGFSFAYIQEAFVSALLDIALDQDKETDISLELSQEWQMLDLADEPVDSAMDLNDYILWRKLKLNIDNLRKQLEDGGDQD